MKDLPEKYAELVKRRPEMAVYGLVHDDPDHLIEGWMRQATAVGHDKPLLEEEAASLIESKLVRELPKNTALYRVADGDWMVTFKGGASNKATDPLSALFAYYLSTPSAKEGDGLPPGFCDCGTCDGHD